MFFVPFIREKLVKEAIEKNHCVTARLISSGDVIRDHGELGFSSSEKTAATYRYEYEGKTYTRRFVGNTRMPNEITLYFQRKPSRATTAIQLGLSESRWFLHYTIISIISTIVIIVFEVINYV